MLIIIVNIAFPAYFTTVKLIKFVFPSKNIFTTFKNSKPFNNNFYKC